MQEAGKITASASKSLPTPGSTAKFPKPDESQIERVIR
jgi:hypothetical protein